MGVSLENPHLRTGDAGASIEDVRASGATAENTDHGRLYLRKLGADLQLFKDRGVTLLVAQGVDANAADVVLSERNESGLTVTLYRTNGDVNAATTIFLWLCSEEDLRENAAKVSGLQIAGETNLNVPLRQMMREFLTRLSARFPQPVGLGRENSYSPPPVEQGSTGKTHLASQFLWYLNRFGEWEVVGLQNPTDYREWAIQQTLAKAYYRKVRSADDTDSWWTRYVAAQDEADRLWGIITPRVDIDQDLLPDRILKSSSIRIRRG